MSEDKTKKHDKVDLSDDDLFDGDSHLNDRFRDETDFQPIKPVDDDNQLQAESFVEVCPEGVVTVVAA